MTAWMPEDEQGSSKELKPTWSYKDDMEFITVLPDTTRDLALLTGDLDPTLTWQFPLGVWVHEFKVATGGFATVICNKWNEACPYCFENEIYKLQNPDYKDRGGRLPKGLSKKALLQAWDFQQKKILWFLAGKRIQEGMDFILQRHADQFNGIVAVTRTGKSLNTTYRVDLSYEELTPQIKTKIKKDIISLDDTRAKMILSHAELKKKTGISPVEFFAMMLPKYPQVDISGWGEVPMVGMGDHIPSIENEVPNPWDEEPEIEEPKPKAKTAAKAKAPTKKPAAKKTAAKPAAKKKPIKINPTIQKKLNMKCTVGVYKGKTLQDIVVQTGKSYIQYLARSGSAAEKKACQSLLKDWDKFYDKIIQEPF